MSVFADAQELYDVLGGFLESIMQDQDIGARFAAANTRFHITYTEPDAEILIDCTTVPPGVHCGQGLPGDIELTMKGDDGHQFWLGKLNINLAMAKGKVKISGPVSTIMKLLPAVRPTFGRYQQYLDAHDRMDLVR
jgi:SCP-2 sterol transfer family